MRVPRSVPADAAVSLQKLVYAVENAAPSAFDENVAGSVRAQTERVVRVGHIKFRNTDEDGLARAPAVYYRKFRTDEFFKVVAQLLGGIAFRR